MTFIHPALVWLLPLAAIPIVLHLLTLYRLKTVELPTFRFLMDSYVQQRRQLKFLEALLAMLRVLFLAALILMFSRPVVRHWSALFGGVGQDVVMIVDCSASMNARSGGVTAIDRARATAGSIAGRLGAADRLTLVRLSSRPELVFSRFAGDTKEIRERIDNLRTSPSAGNVFAAFQELFGSNVKRPPGQRVYFLTDSQSTGWRELKDAAAARILPADVPLTVVNVGSKSPIDNRASSGAAPRETRVVAGLPVLLRPNVTNHSPTEPATVTVGVFVDDKEVGRQVFNLKPGETGSGEIVYRPLEPGIHRCRFETAGDPFPDDDSYLFTIEVVPPLRVLLVNGAPNSDPFENEALYVRTALQAQPDRQESGSSGDLTPDKSKSKSRGGRKTARDEKSALAAPPDFVRSLDVQEIADAQLTRQHLDDASLVILVNAGNLNGERFNWLREFVAAGGGLIIWPGDKINADVWTKQFFAAVASNPRARPSRERDRRKSAELSPTDPLIGASIAAAVGDVNKVAEFERLSRIDFSHPLLAVFDDADAKYLTSARFYRTFPIELAADATNSWSLAQFGNGKAALVESRYGAGSVLIAGFSANARDSNLPLRPEYVPLLLRMASYVMKQPEVDGPSVVANGAPAELAVAMSWSPATARFTDPEKRVTTLELHRSGPRLAAAFDNTSVKGYYTVDVAGGRAEQPRAASMAFAVNLPPDESDFRMLSQQNLAEWFPGRQAKLIDASVEAQQTLGPIGAERETWRGFIWLLLLVFSGEFLLATFGGRRESTGSTKLEAIERAFGQHEEPVPAGN